MIAGRYTLVREIGRGGMGVVWLARDELLGRQVALKRIGLLPGASETDLRRAESEGRLAAALNHPHVVGVYDMADQDGEHWLVMEYVDGPSLSTVLKDEGTVSHTRAAILLGQAADALAAAHAGGIVHRDVKPSNMLVGHGDELKLADFGIARADADPSLTMTGTMTGSPAYLAPEVASGGTATSASDVWSLGASLFHALSGQPPYDLGENVIGGLYRIVHEDPPRLEGADWLAPVLEATMAKDPADRWSMAQVRSYLESGAKAASPVRLATPVPAPRNRPAADAPESPGDGTQVIARPVVSHAAPPQHRTPWVLIGMALLLLIGAVIFAVVALRPGDGSRPQGSTGTSQSPTPTPKPPAATAVTADAMEKFIEDYLATVTVDPSRTWPRLTPEFQAESGGFGKYSGFWRTIRSADPRRIDADPKAMTVSYGVDYVTAAGTRQSDNVTLRLVKDGDSYRIAGEH